MPGSTNRNGKLFFSGVDVCDLAREYGSPLLILSEDMIRKNIRKLRTELSAVNLDFDVRYAVKANYNPAVLKIVREEGCGIDASSENELNLAFSLGFLPEGIIFSPNNAGKDELIRASGMGVAVNFDSLGQFELLSDSVPDTVSFRIKTAYGRGEFKGTTTSGPNTKFGITEAEAIQAYRMALERGVKKFGIHIMAGSNILDPTHFGKVVDSICSISTKLESELELKFEFIDIGGGLGVPYTPGIDEVDLKTVAITLKNTLAKYYGDTPPRLLLEPGRYIVANAGILAGTVMDVKKQDLNFLGSDVGMNILLRPALYGAHHHIVIANKLDKEISGKYEVVGQICESTDVIGKAVELPDAETGDIIGIFNAGAYVTSMGSNYNGRLQPAEILVADGRARIIRQRDEFSDFTRNFV